MSSGLVDLNVGLAPPGSRYGICPHASGFIWQDSHVLTLALVNGGWRIGWDPISCASWVFWNATTSWRRFNFSYSVFMSGAFARVLCVPERPLFELVDVLACVFTEVLPAFAKPLLELTYVLARVFTEVFPALPKLLLDASLVSWELLSLALSELLLVPLRSLVGV